MEHWGKLLNSLGFTDSEAAIYLLSLEMGAASVQNLARKAKVSRVTTYAVIESLASHGLMSSVQKGKKKFYAAESPERLLSYVRKRLEGMETTLREVEQLLPHLKLLQRGEKPVVKLLEGKEGIEALQVDLTETAPKSIDEICNRSAIGEIFTAQDLQPFRSKLDSMGVIGRMIYSGTPQGGTRKGTSIKHIVQSPIPFTGDVMIYGSRVALATFKGRLIVVIIESEELAQTMRALFELAWGNATLV